MQIIMAVHRNNHDYCRREKKNIKQYGLYDGDPRVYSNRLEVLIVQYHST